MGIPLTLGCLFSSKESCRIGTGLIGKKKVKGNGRYKNHQYNSDPVYWMLQNFEVNYLVHFDSPSWPVDEIG
jgi:hypothetical protein